VNLPTRGIGNKSLDLVREQAKAADTSLWDSAAHCVANGIIGAKGELALSGFLKLIEQLGRDIAGLELHEQVDHVINNSGLVEHHKKEKADRGEARVENLNELVSACARLRTRRIEYGR
jgi:DNA helicase-2/ATP-dependent DNA helicase PcrA